MNIKKKNTNLSKNMYNTIKKKTRNNVNKN